MMYSVNGFTKLLLIISIAVMPVIAKADLNIERLSKQDTERVKKILSKLEPLVQQRRSAGTIATLAFDDLYAPLSSSNKKLLKSFQDLDAKKLNLKLPYRGIASGNEDFIAIKGQKVKISGKYQPLPTQYLTKQVYLRYTDMMAAMQKDIGKRLYVESGYRSSAYQLYVFINSLKNHKYSVLETAKFVALPGYSEHGDPNRQAIDFINEDGVNQDRPKEFENLPEYKWLTENAKKFSFVLSYPKDSKDGITFEPWHWRCEK
jgi:LAS superfamily LD-carboxypeptidase LdcB